MGSLVRWSITAMIAPLAGLSLSGPSDRSDLRPHHRPHAPRGNVALGAPAPQTQTTRERLGVRLDALASGRGGAVTPIAPTPAPFYIFVLGYGGGQDIASPPARPGEQG